MGRGRSRSGCSCTECQRSVHQKPKTAINNNLRIIWVGGGVAVTQGSHNVGQRIVLPADQDVSAASVVVHDLSHTVLVVTVAGGVNGDTQIGGQGLDSVQRTGTSSV